MKINIFKALHGYNQVAGMGEYLCIGDYVCLYCEDTEGYLYSQQSSSVQNGLQIFHKQDRTKPNNISNPHAVVFEVCIQNRYKLTKKHRKFLIASKQDENAEGGAAKSVVSASKMAAMAENKDNEAEQKRQHGKRVRYGETIQLRHMFTKKYVHTSTTQTSKRDKNNLVITLQDFNAKNAQFKILPRYKVKAEGEIVQIFDQIVFESVKSPGHYFHSSDPYQIDYTTWGSELNLGVEKSGFTLIGSYRENLEDQKWFARGGSVIRLFHKELEAYLVAEGLFGELVSESVHFRIRAMDRHRPKTLSPPTSGITYWQIEAEHSILDGDVLDWEQQVRLRHMVTRQYLCLDSKREVSLTADSSDPRTVFRLHSVLKERDEIQYESYARIEHVITGCWLHAKKDEDYERKRVAEGENAPAMSELTWDRAMVRQVGASNASMYDDAYTIQKVEPEDMQNFNYVAGIVPFLFNLIIERRSRSHMNARRCHGIIVMLRELKDFILPEGLPSKKRQKLLRNLRVIDLFVKFLQIPIQDTSHETESISIRIFKEAYDVLHAYMIGKSRKNALYFAKNIDFFQTQFTQKGGIGLNVAQMIVELIRDKRKIVDRLNKHNIDRFIELLTLTQNYRFLDLLNVLCVCDGVSIPNTQSYIVEKWLKHDKDTVYMLDRGQNINQRPNIMYVSTTSGSSWMELHEFVDPSCVHFAEEKYQFLIHQLDLFKALCHGRNDVAISFVTREVGFLSWEDAFLCLRLEILPEYIRAKFCELIITLFVDVGNNYSVLDNPNICFVYDYVGSKDAEKGEDQYVVKDLVTIFPTLRDWISDFLSNNMMMTASQIGHNILIEQVLRLLQHLVKFGYYMDMDDVTSLLKPLLSLMDGSSDLPFPKDKTKGNAREINKAISHFRQVDRYDPSVETEAIVNAKYQAMEVLDLLITYQRNERLKSLMALFKSTEEYIRMPHKKKKKNPNVMVALLYKYDTEDQSKKARRHQKKVQRQLTEMFERSAIFNIQATTEILLDLSKYKYDKMVQKSLEILNKLYSSKSGMFKLAVEAQVVVTSDSGRVHREVQRFLPVLRRLSMSKMNKAQEGMMNKILDELSGFLSLPKAPDEPHHMNQNVMLSHGVLNILLDILAQEFDPKLMDQYIGMKEIFHKSLHVLKMLIRENDKVQHIMFAKLDDMLEVWGVESDLAIMLKEIFSGNQATCLKIQPRQLQKIILLAAEHQEHAPEFLDLLMVLVKVEGLDLTLKRNQAFTMKYIMQNFKKVAYMLDQTRESREQILTNQKGIAHLRYFVCLVDLLATCAEGDNKFIESLCQTILPIEEILWVLNHHSISYNIKKPFLKFMGWVYMKTTTNMIESGAADLQHKMELWDYIVSCTSDMMQLYESVKLHKDKMPDLLREQPSRNLSEQHDTKMVVHAGIYYLLDGVLPFLQSFYAGFYAIDKDLHPQESVHTESLASILGMFCKEICPMLTMPSHMKTVVASLTTVSTTSSSMATTLSEVLNNFSNGVQADGLLSDVRKGNMEYYRYEIQLNSKLRTFASHAGNVYNGYNTVMAQTGFKSKRPFTDITDTDTLPLGEEFQSLVKCFFDEKEKKLSKRYARAAILIEALHISAQQTSHFLPTNPVFEELDVKCLQVLRALIHNEERKLPYDWEMQTSNHKVKLQLAHIKNVQDVINGFDVIHKVLPHMARRSDIVLLEVLSFTCIMLYNANRDVQKSLQNYFLSTKEEVFFMAVIDRLQISTNSIKEKYLLMKKCSQRSSRRSLLAQHEAKKKDPSTNDFKMSLSIGQRAMQEILTYEDRVHNERINGWRTLAVVQTPDFHRKQSAKRRWRKQADVNSRDKMFKNIVNGNETEALISECLPEPAEFCGADESQLDDAEISDNSVMDFIDNSDDGSIELVLKMLARICDGQNTDLQDYLREQPDNIKSFNIIGETTDFLNAVYSSVTNKTIDLVIQLFDTLNEFCTGNQDNRVVMIDRKVVDYINFLLRSTDFPDCTMEEVLKLQQTIAHFIISLIEENGPGASIVAKEVKDTVDKEALFRCMYECHEAEIGTTKKLESAGDHSGLAAGALLAAKNLGSQLLPSVVPEKKNSLKDQLADVGFHFYLIIARFYDIDINLRKKMEVSAQHMKAYHYYKKNCLSIEVIKDDVIQKVNFCMKNKNILREEVKEKMKWSVDRSSPSGKIRDLMSWTKDIMLDISYQKKILNNPVALFFTKGWVLWNYGTILLSLAINVLMLTTWDSEKTLADVETGATADDQIWKEIKNPVPVITYIGKNEYQLALYSLGGTHNLLSLFVLISYFLSNHPRMPESTNIVKSFKSMCSKKVEEVENTAADMKAEKTEHISKLDVKFFSFSTFFYFLFLGMSIAGTLYHGYFFAFHLLNIVNNNQLLNGVIKAVTQNGMSLLWVAILGIVIIYIYALIGFAIFRASFDAGSLLYCDTLFHCLITLLRFGLIGDMFEEMKPAENIRTFETFWPIVIYHLSFFILITTIGLNIIFGIIVDTFSELRDLKWRAESDMKDTCFICSRNSYDFEHHGGGFDHHVTNEHSMWSYVFFVIHLNDLAESDYTALELYVSKLLRHQNYDFFPLNRALSLAETDKDSAESKIDDLLLQVIGIAEKQKEEDAEKKRKIERMKQRRWQEKHRRFITGGIGHGPGDRRDDDDDDDDHHGGQGQGILQKEVTHDSHGSLPRHSRSMSADPIVNLAHYAREQPDRQQRDSQRDSDLYLEARSRLSSDEQFLIPQDSDSENGSATDSYDFPHQRANEPPPARDIMVPPPSSPDFPNLQSAHSGSVFEPEEDSAVALLSLQRIDPSPRQPSDGDDESRV